MANVTRKYELVFIMKADLGEEATAALIQKFKDVITTNGVLENVDEWGKRRLAYPIQNQVEGYYVQLNFSAGMELPAELYRQFKITDGVIRSLIVNLEK